MKMSLLQRQAADLASNQPDGVSGYRMARGTITDLDSDLCKHVRRTADTPCRRCGLPIGIGVRYITWLSGEVVDDGVKPVGDPDHDLFHAADKLTPYYSESRMYHANCAEKLGIVGSWQDIDSDDCDGR